MEKETKICPFCAENIQNEAIKCKHCGSDLQEKKQEIKGKKRKCSYCKSEIDKKAIVCPNCKKKQGIGCGGLIIICFGLLMIYFIATSSPTSTPTVEDQCNSWYNAPKICADMSSWDGSYKPLVDVVKNNLKDPSSFKHISTNITDKGDALGIRMVYSGTNGFGAVVQESISVVVNKETLEIKY